MLAGRLDADWPGSIELAAKHGAGFPGNQEAGSMCPCNYPGSLGIGEGIGVFG